MDTVIKNARDGGFAIFEGDELVAVCKTLGEVATFFAPHCEPDRPFSEQEATNALRDFAGGSWIQAVRLHRALSGSSLKDAKHAVDGFRYILDQRQ